MTLSFSQFHAQRNWLLTHALHIFNQYMRLLCCFWSLMSLRKIENCFFRRICTETHQQHHCNMLRHCFEWLQHCSNIATLCCAKKRRCESSRVTSPLEKLPTRYKRALAFLRERDYPLLTHWISILLNKVAFHFRMTFPKNRGIESVIRCREAVRRYKNRETDGRIVNVGRSGP